MGDNEFKERKKEEEDDAQKEENLVAKIRKMKKQKNEERKASRLPGEPKRKKRKLEKTTDAEHLLPPHTDQNILRLQPIEKTEKRKSTDCDIPTTRKLKQRRIGDFITPKNNAEKEQKSTPHIPIEDSKKLPTVDKMPHISPLATAHQLPHIPNFEQTTPTITPTKKLPHITPEDQELPTVENVQSDTKPHISPTPHQLPHIPDLVTELNKSGLNLPSDNIGKSEKKKRIYKIYKYTNP